MNIEFENKDSVLTENCFVTQENCGVYGWYGLSYFEIGMKGSTLQDLYDLKDCVDAMVKEAERLIKKQLTEKKKYDIIKSSKEREDWI